MSREVEAARRARDDLFLAACWDGDDAIVEEALRVGVAPNCCDKDGVTGLMKAITRANQEVVNLLLQHPKTDVNHRSGPAALTVGVRRKLDGGDADAPLCPGTDYLTDELTN